jgi:hypothetical protein
MLSGRIMLFDEQRKMIKTKLWHLLGVIPAVLRRDRGMPHNTPIKIADFQIETGALNLSKKLVCNNFTVGFGLFLGDTWCLFFSKAVIDKEVNDVIFLYIA